MRTSFFLILVFLTCSVAATQTPAQYQEAAKKAFQSEIAQEGKDCANASTTYDENMCIGKVSDTTEQHFDTFYQNLLSLLAADPNNQARLKAAQTTWLKYRDESCSAISDFYKGGTIRPSAVVRCQIALTRSRMRDLNNLYYIPLHN
jgi:uncharacterized protein YecT (DUF1311 family)